MAWWFTIALAIFCPMMGVAEGERSPRGGTDLTDLSLEDLMNIEVSSVSKKLETRREAAAAVYVLTAEDIRRSGATSVAEVLRNVPGISVARLDANKWAVTSRGFNGRFANKLLVLIDGRTVYTPLFAGVFWDVQDLALEDVERIEVIRGPGGTLWGSNAVNGVINITTKHARDTQGGLLHGIVGTEDRMIGTLRYGGTLGEDTYYRVFAKSFDRDEGALASGGSGGDGWHMTHLGLRLDAEPWSEDRLTVLGDVYEGGAGTTDIVSYPYPPFMWPLTSYQDLSGGNLVLRWQHEHSDRSDTAFQVYYDRTNRADEVTGDDRDTIDIDFQHHLEIGQRHDIVWGAGYRYTKHFATNTRHVVFDPKNRQDDIFSAFIQDEIAFLDEHVRLTLGMKVEHNDYTDFEFQPNARIAWVPNERHCVWTAVSRAVRIPARAETDVHINAAGFPFGLARVSGWADVDAESLVAYEIGYRYTPSNRVTLDLAAFYNRYQRLRTAEFWWPSFEWWPLPPHVVLNVVGGDQMDGITRGVEAGIAFQAMSWWQVRANYSVFDIALDVYSKTPDFYSIETEGSVPQNKVCLESRMDLSHNVELDAMFRYVDELESFDLDGYCSLDVRLAWAPREDLEVAIVGQNLTDNQRPEFEAAFLPSVATEVERAVYASILWRF